MGEGGAAGETTTAAGSNATPAAGQAGQSGASGAGESDTASQVAAQLAEILRGNPAL
jgi:hypothetical protein